ncbi:MAG TPA: 5'/3'-nucleotidase SurE [Gemmatimonadaceae bacterium]|nr:5'/3'-nucleotidase SurE [Gemmatimonadaceae bacterium]
MQLLCTNDDGILAQGLDCLVRAASRIGDVTVVAPDREQSATSHSLTLHHPVRPVPRGPQRWQVDGTPTDCVMLAVEGLMGQRPSWVLSGINHGHNMGEDVLYSGTVAAAMEGVTLGIPAIALSFAGGELQADPELLSDQVDVVAELLAHLTSLRNVPRDTLLNINLPARRAADIRGVRLTRLGRRVYSDSLVRMRDPRGREIFWIGGGSAEWSGAEDSDFRAVQEGYISVTPLSLDLTHTRMLEEATSWWMDLP